MMTFSWRVLSLLLVCSSGWPPVHGAAAGREFRLAAQPASSALTAFARQAEVDVIFAWETVQGVTCRPLGGEFEPAAALAELLRETALEAVRSGPTRFVVRPVSPPESAASAAVVWRARERLGPERWSRVLRLYCADTADKRGAIRESAALLFALEGMLWLYVPELGTQSISLRTGRLALDQAEPGPLLRAVLPGFRAYADVTGTRCEQPAAGQSGVMPYDCLIASLARWDELRQEPTAPERARLLSFYADVSGERRGHTVLEYWRDGARWIFDPAEPAAPRRLATRIGEDPLDTARALVRIGQGERPAKAMTLELRESPAPGARPLVVVRTERRNLAARS